MGSIKGSLMGAAGAVAYDSFISPMIPLNGVTKDVAELAIGYYASRKGGIIGDTGKTLMVLNAYQLLSRIKLGGFGGSNGSSNVIG